MTEKILWEGREIPVLGRYEVLVCGGGPAGFVAAVAAAVEAGSKWIQTQFAISDCQAEFGIIEVETREAHFSGTERALNILVLQFLPWHCKSPAVLSYLFQWRRS